MNNSKLAADPLALVLGILSLVLGIAGCCCYGITAIIPLVLAIVGLISANRSLKEYRQNPEAFSQQSASNVNTAKILNIIGIVINGFVVLISMALLLFMGQCCLRKFLMKFEIIPVQMVITIMNSKSIQQKLVRKNTI